MSQTSNEKVVEKKQLADVLIDKLIMHMIRAHEGFSSTEYTCSTNHVTIGFGHNLSAKPLKLKKPISVGIANEILKTDFYAAYREAEQFSFFKKLDRVQQGAIVSMIYNMGITAFSRFKKTIAYLDNGEYEKAAKESLRSTWAKQVGDRAKQVAELIRTGNVKDIPVMAVTGLSGSVNKSYLLEMQQIKDYFGEINEQ